MSPLKKDNLDEFQLKLQGLRVELKELVAKHLGESVEFALATISRKGDDIPRLDCVTDIEPAMAAAVFQAMYFETKTELDAEIRARANTKKRIH